MRNESIIPDTLNIYSDQPGGRSKKSIMDVVMNNVINLRKLYNRRLAADMAISGKIFTRFKIDHYGRVISVKVDSTTISDTLMENALCKQISAWKFNPNTKKGDVTEVVYPFIFSQ